MLIVHDDFSFFRNNDNHNNNNNNKYWITIIIPEVYYYDDDMIKLLISFNKLVVILMIVEMCFTYMIHANTQTIIVDFDWIRKKKRTKKIDDNSNEKEWKKVFFKLPYHCIVVVVDVVAAGSVVFIGSFIIFSFVFVVKCFMNEFFFLKIKKKCHIQTQRVCVFWFQYNNNNNDPTKQNRWNPYCTRWTWTKLIIIGSLGPFDCMIVCVWLTFFFQMTKME